LGVLRLLERMNHLNAKPSQYDGLVEEIVSAQLEVFKKLYLKDRDIQNIIVVDDYLSRLLKRGQIEGTKEGYVDADVYRHFMNAVQRKTALDICKAYDIPEEILPMLHITVVLIKQILTMMDAKLIWAPGVTLCDGIAYEYAEKNKLAVIDHDFEQDIIACAQNISKRYMGSKKRSETLEKIALTIFDSMKKVHGLGKRERLLLRLATMLHDCGKFISMMNLGECSYHIVMSTEIIGLSHTEREIVANVVKYNHADFDYPETVDYLTIAKLTAILRVANALDRSHKQKFKDIKTALKDNRLVMTVASDADITLEKGLFKERADFFEEVFSVKPVIKQRKSL
ncbi:MAG: HD domain-containing protein, partial [Lachnospiraceae bacterium]|nr:HD domain-containing protein [Lachnospiraceae bacterium]